MPAMKRKAGSPTKSTKKAKVKDEVTPKIDELHAILSNHECDIEGPGGNRSMLLSALPHALSTPSDERHAYQGTLAKIIGEVMHAWVAKHEQKVADAKTNVDTTETEKVAAAATQESAANALTAQKETVKAAKESFNAAFDAEKEAASALRTADANVSGFDKVLQDIITNKDHISKVYNDHFLAMKTAEAPDSKSHLKEILQTVKDMASAEQALSLALGPALKKPAADRGTFDNMAVDAVETSFKGSLEKLDGDIANADTTKAAKQAEAATAKTSHDDTVAKKEECQAAMKEAVCDERGKEMALHAAEKNVEATSKAASKATKEIGQEQKRLDKAKGNLASFQFLLDRTTPVEHDAPAEAEATGAVLD